MGNLIKSLFQGEQFKSLIESLISKHTVGYLDFGVKKEFYFPAHCFFIIYYI